MLTGGLLASAAFLVAGLLLARGGVVRAGMILLMLTPVARVVVLTIGLFRQRDYVFGLVSLWILAVLASGIYVAFRLESRRSTPAPSATPRALAP